MHSSAHALPRAAATFISSAAVTPRVAHRDTCQKSSHSRVVARQRLRFHTQATDGPVQASTVPRPRAVSPAELNEVRPSFNFRLRYGYSKDTTEIAADKQ